MRGNIKSTERRTRSNTKCKTRGCTKLALVGEGGLCAKHLTGQLGYQAPSTKPQAPSVCDLGFSIPERRK